jgi:muramoyltetrapeptide carboxypeptidase
VALECECRASGTAGSAELLEFLDPRVFIDNPKPFVGFCDNGYINAFLATSCGLSSRYGYTFLHEFGEAGGPFQETLEHFASAVSPKESFICKPFSSRTSERVMFLDPVNESRIRSRNVDGALNWIRPGTAVGRLMGGEIATLPGIMRTANVDLAGDIFFWDVSYHDLPIDRLFADLCEIAAVREVGAMLVGAHPAMALEVWSDRVRDLVERFLPDTHFPIVANTYTSHRSPSWLVPFSEECSLNEDGSLTFRFDDAGQPEECQAGQSV